MSDRLFFYDLETTGLDHNHCAIHQIAGIIVIDGQVKEKFDFKVKPHLYAKIDAKALEVGDVTLDQIKSYPDSKLVYDNLVEMLSKYVNKYNPSEKFHLAGYNNINFDNRFFRKFFELNGDKYFGSWFWSDSIDVMVMASNYLREDRHSMKNFRLTTVFDNMVSMGLIQSPEDGKAHDAFYDIYMTKEIHDAINRQF